MDASELIQRANFILWDTAKIRWTDDEMLLWLNDGQMAVVERKPEASPRTLPVPLVAGTRQSLPDDGLRLLKVKRNMGTNGNTPGKPVRKAERLQIEAHDRFWHEAAAAAEIAHYLFDEDDPLHFDVYPPARAGIYVELQYVIAPAPITEMDQDISLDALYNNALLDYVLYRAYSKDAEQGNNRQLAIDHYQAFEAGLGMKTQGDAVARPVQ